MVRLTLKRSLRDDSCCRVDVMKGGTGLRFFSACSDRLNYIRGAIQIVDNSARRWPRCVTRMSHRSLLLRRAVRTGGFLAFRATSMVQYSSLLKRADFTFAFDDEAQRNGLHAAGGKAAANFVPQQRRDFVTDQAVEHAAGLLRLHQVNIDCQRLVECLLHSIGGDFVEHHAENGRLIRLLRLEFFLQMPADGFAFAIRVSRQVDGIDAFGRLLQLGDELLSCLR